MTFGPDFAPSDTMTSNLVQSVRSYAQGGQRPAVNTLDSAFDSATSDNFTVKYPLTGIQPGQTLEIGWVEYSIVDVSTASKQLTVVPAEEGTSAQHAAGDRITMQPIYTTRRIIDELNTDLDDLTAAGLYRVVTVTGDDGQVTLPAGALDVLDIWSDEEKPRKLPAAQYSITDEAGGAVLRGPATIGWANVGCAFNKLPVDSDELVGETTGLWTTAMDLPPLGAAVRLLAGSESQRNIIVTQGETRRAEEVPAGSITTALRNLMSLRQSRIVAEVSRLQARYSYSSHVGVY